MLLAPHILTGAAIAAQFSNPFVGMLFAFLSHFVLDSIPHWEYSIKPLKQIKTRGVLYVRPILYRVLLDMTIGFVVVILVMALSGKHISLDIGIFGGFFAALPDGLTFLLYLSPKNRLIRVPLYIVYAIHRKLHFNKEKGLPPMRVGLTTQAIVSLLALYFLIF